MSPLERIAHDIICIVKYGSPGGSANVNDVKRVTQYLSRVGELPKELPKIIAMPPKAVPNIDLKLLVKQPSVALKLPKISPPSNEVSYTKTVKVQLPTIKLP